MRNGSETMVDTIGPGRVTAITPGKAVGKTRVDKRPKKCPAAPRDADEPDAREEEAGRIGTRIDERC